MWLHGYYALRPGAEPAEFVHSCSFLSLFTFTEDINYSSRLVIATK
jgi:hypothetical protein